jgi:molybdopterin converting factor small subunit
VHVTVKFLGSLRDQLGAKSLSVELPAAATYRSLLDTIAPTVGGKLVDWAWDPARRSFSARMLVMRNMSDLRSEETQLADGDEILVLLPLAGG